MVEVSGPVRVGVATVLLVAAAAWALNRARTRRRRWLQVGTLGKIYLYPLKSGRCVELAEAECTSLGLRHRIDENRLLRDRVFVVYDEKTKDLVSGKYNPKLLFTSAAPKTPDTVIFSYPDKEDIEVTLPNSFDKDSTVILWRNEKVKTVDLGDDIAQWISEAVRGTPKGLRVGYWPESETWRRDIVKERPQEKVVFTKLANEYTGAYADLAGYLIVNNGSVEDLNKRLVEADQCGPMNFRPSLLIEGAQPYAEDQWDWIKVGEVELRTFRPCTRCVMTNLNDKGEKNQNEQPMKTLRKYRMMKHIGEERVQANYPVMGVYAGLERGGTIRLGDPVYVSV